MFFFWFQDLLFASLYDEEQKKTKQKDALNLPLSQLSYTIDTHIQVITDFENGISSPELAVYC